MKIALITIHHANSYGGNLQAFASQKLLSRYGETKIIDYKTPHLSSSMRLIRFGGGLRSILRVGKDLFRLRPRKRLIVKFKKFAQQFLVLTRPIDRRIDLGRLEAEFDVFVCGSDQIWNPKVLGYFDTSYMLDFVKIKKKISFASSSGSHRFSTTEEPNVVNCLNSFSYLSVREKDTGSMVSSILDDRVVSHVLDPTLMLNKNEWLDYLGLKDEASPERYVLVYTLKKDSLTRAVVDLVALELNLKVVAIDQDTILGYRVDKHLMDASPVDYVQLFSQASFVVTNSFHGTAFSVNFGIPFVVTIPETGLNRIKGFLESVGLCGRLIESVTDFEKVMAKPIDQDLVFKKLNSLRQQTFEYLDEALN
jgi:hypothetical protein